MGITVLSCNLLAGRADARALARIIDERDVDIVCAQELSLALAAELAKRLPHGDLQHDQVHRGSAIASRRPIDLRRLELPGRAGWIARLAPEEWNPLQVPIEIVNVHISAPHLWPYFPNRVRRRAQLDLLLADRAASDDVPHAILGDFNASPAWPVYRQMRSRYDDAALAARRGNAPLANTWPSLPAIGLRGLIRIDHCFTRGLVAHSVEVLDLPGSDHLALCVVLDLPD
ncbi:MAG: endonuclease/exonuclease/phosphatase family protein [Woeseiaceae bacterium]|nr:endonuclease/exonuclease/phosphatase family protein [Woeseiaceae bacterium]